MHLIVLRTERNNKNYNKVTEKDEDEHVFLFPSLLAIRGTAAKNYNFNK